MPSLTGISFAHPAVPADRRAALCLRGDSLRDAQGRLRSRGYEAFVLCTCLRVEIVWPGGPVSASEVLSSIYGDDSMSSLGVTRSDWDLFLHLCRIGSGLDSPTVGEREVLSQFRQSVSAYQESAQALGRVLQSAVGISRSARRHLGEPANGSLGAVAAEATVGHEPVAVLGAGAMARAAVQTMSGERARIYSRRPGRVGGQRTRPWEESGQALATFAAVISTVPGPSPLLPDALVQASLAGRNQPLLLIDLGMPPGFDSLQGHPAVAYRGIDEVASAAAGSAQPQVEETVRGEAAAIWHRLTASDRVGSVITAMVGEADRAVDEEVERFIGRLSGTDDPEQVVRQLAHTVARRVLHRPISYLSSSERGSASVELIAEAFGVPDE